jgi:hypothetical protein
MLRVFSLLVLCGCFLTLAGCGSSNTPKAEPAPLPGKDGGPKKDSGAVAPAPLPLPK